MYVSTDLLSLLLAEDLQVEGNMLVSDMSLEAAEKLWLRNAFLKKFRNLKSPQADALAIEKFEAYNERCRTFKLEPKALYDDVLINEVKLLIDRWVHPQGQAVGLSELLEFAELGPGANIAVGSNNFYTKLFDSPLSTTSLDLQRLYRSAISKNPTWTQAEKGREAQHGTLVVEGSRLSTVPKQFDISRTTCTEPTLNMFFQRGIGNFLESCLMRIGINLSTQPSKNQELARIGSVNGAFGTTDLRSASDSISITLVKELFPRYFVEWLLRTRSPETVLPDGRRVELSMISSMGNGFTFALQTMIFAAVVVACYRLRGRKAFFGTSHNPRREVQAQISAGVFGDDIAVRSDMYFGVNRALELFGFDVNDDKSFNTGDFRESCGQDYFRGLDIRGVYLKHFRNDSDCYSAINRLNRWSTRSGVALDLTLSYLLGMVRFLPIPYRDGDDEGVKVPFVLSGCDFFCINTRSPLYRARCRVPESFALPEEPSQSRACRIPYSFSYNADGILVAVVGGFVKDGRVGVRTEESRPIRSKVRQRSVPFWDYIPTAETIQSRGDGWHAVVASLFNRIGPICSG